MKKQNYYYYVCNSVKLCKAVSAEKQAMNLHKKYLVIYEMHNFNIETHFWQQ